MLWLCDEQWPRIRKYFPEEHIPAGRVCRNRFLPEKCLKPFFGFLTPVLNGICCAGQSELQNGSSPISTLVSERNSLRCHVDLVNTLRDEGALDESECFVGATVSSAESEGNEIGRIKRGMGV
jgi:hypothetical protein